MLVWGQMVDRQRQSCSIVPILKKPTPIVGTLLLEGSCTNSSLNVKLSINVSPRVVHIRGLQSTTLHIDVKFDIQRIEFVQGNQSRNKVRTN